ncbi:WbuC family cupin fold metalloprotein [Paucidesulfovibrio longus]|uniref:WbuC family cupin fold metalloprotein n=1 Tax=Paucidesulfovibrio longus TaxID=889 RepID=UPI0003B7A6DF|nr:WbuC family cupin fold metalloprotein [Paucidesulfovibrio longus]
MDEGKSFPLALEAPETELTAISGDMIHTALAASRRSPRRRIIQPLHKTADSPLHRMLNVAQPGTYIRPHRHLDPPKAESLVVLQGRIGFVTFDAAGEVTGTYVLGPDEDAVGIDMEPGAYHSFVVLEPDTVLFEVKPGPYAKATDKAFAAWAPEEFTDAAREYVERLAGMFQA